MQLQESLMLIAVDFDGTCVDFAFPLIGKDKRYAVKALKLLIEAGHRLVLWTCREDHPIDVSKFYLQAAVMWFEERDIPLVGINAPPEGEDIFSEYTSNEPRVFRKLCADAYIDEKNHGVENGEVDWLQVVWKFVGLAAVRKLLREELDEEIMRT